MKKSVIDVIAMVLLVIGGLNWGLVGLGVGDAVNLVLGSIPILATVVYVLIGLAGLWGLYMLFKK